ncbi:MAG: hypothetical protein NXI12_14665 [Alphaproteobacteria bacterium]|nr:hypothetical protein [Alphaproteobacteria bacterium]
MVLRACMAAVNPPPGVVLMLQAQKKTARRWEAPGRNQSLSDRP